MILDAVLPFTINQQIWKFTTIKVKQSQRLEKQQKQIVKFEEI